MNNEELISGLRTVSALPNLMGPAAGWCKLALDAIETLTRERDEAREALKPFASECETWADDAPDGYRIKIKLDTKSMMSRLTLADLRRARAALAGGKQE